ncbi:MAG: hypothetical protein COA78_38805 [Blastopirellula sp.]|nr:MAG: hypothetical protein COA78_38805 [Blastopirellula sp.]
MKVTRLGQEGPTPRSWRLGSTLIQAKLLLAAFIVFLNLPSTEAQDLPTVDNALPDFTNMTLEDLIQQEMTVHERLEETRRLTLQDGILGGHVHEAGEWMIGYKYKFMDMDGNRTGTNRMSTADVFAEGFMVSPTRMTMEMHMLHLMHAPSDEFTWMAMLPLKRLTMDHITSGAMPFTTQTEGIGDVSLSGFYTFYNIERKVFSGRSNPGCDDTQASDCWRNSWDELRRAHFGLTMHFPTGSIDERGATPMNSNTKLPYPMQLGSGTYDLEPNLTIYSITEKWVWGAQASMLFRLGRNKHNYSLGDRLSASAWTSRKLSDQLSLDMRLEESIWGDVNGADPELNPMMVPTARPDLQGGNRLDLWLGTTYYIPEGSLEGNRLHVEVGVPLYQSLNGPQLETDLLLQASWSWTY